MIKIKCLLKNSERGDLIATLFCPSFVFLVPPHRADINFNTYTNKKELIEFIKKLLDSEIEKMEIKYE